MHPVKLTLFRVFLDAGPAAKFLLLLLLIGVVTAVIAAVHGRRETLARRLHLIATIRSACLLIALLGPLVGGMNIFIGVANVNIANLAIMAPGLAEALLIAGCGVLSALVATIAHAAVAPPPLAHG